MAEYTSQLTAEVLTTGTPVIRTTQLTAEVLTTGSSTARLSQITAEVLVPLRQPINVTSTGVNATALLGDITVVVPAKVSVDVEVPGQVVTADLGTASISLGISALLSGTGTNTIVGEAHISAVSVLSLTGLSADVSLGNVIASIRKFVPVSGTEALGEFASVTVLTGCSVRVIGVQAVGYVGRPLVWSKINDSQTPDWTIPNTANSVTWAQVTE